jgi:acetyl esterase/lipase
MPEERNREVWAWVVGIAVLGLLGCRVPAVRASEVKVIRDVPYVHGPDADADRHQLDLYLPQDKKDCPVIVFVHGGAWVMGDKGFFGWGDAIGRFFAGQGVVAVLPSYRLAPQNSNADQAQDVARAVAWTYRHIRDYGGNPGRLFLCGHSAGGQLVSLVATDPRYLKAEGLKLAIIKGVIGVSAVYQAPEVLHVRLFDGVFGKDPAARRQASPLFHVRAGLAPFLIVYAEHELPTIGGDARAMAAALKKAGDHVQLLYVGHRDHESVMFRARGPEDPVARAILSFVKGKDQMTAAR